MCRQERLQNPSWIAISASAGWSLEARICVKRGPAGIPCRAHRNVGREGLEVVQETSGNDALAVEGNVKCNALADDSSAIDADLQSIIDAWAELPRSVQARILALVKAEVGKR